jgi:alkylation response protein AidB-like acyl-CoA dehydrogenase
MSLALAHPAPGAADTPDLDVVLPQLTSAFAATADQHDREASLPFENFDLLRRHGLLALTAPQRLGGRAADLPTTLKVVQAVARGEPATALVLVMQYLFTLRWTVAPASPTS